MLSSAVCVITLYITLANRGEHYLYLVSEQALYFFKLFSSS